MKFGNYLEETQTPEWKKAYIDYKKLKKCIHAIVDSGPTNASSAGSVGSPRQEANEPSPSLQLATSDSRPPQGTTGSAVAASSDSKTSPVVRSQRTPASPFSFVPSRTGGRPVTDENERLADPHKRTPTYGASGYTPPIGSNISIRPPSPPPLDELPPPMQDLPKSDTPLDTLTKPNSSGQSSRTSAGEPQRHSPNMASSVRTSPFANLRPSLRRRASTRTGLPSSGNSRTDTLDEVYHALTPVEAHFFEVLDEELYKVENFYLEREKEAMIFSSLLHEQLKELQVHRRIYHASQYASHLWAPLDALATMTKVLPHVPPIAPETSPASELRSSSADPGPQLDPEQYHHHKKKLKKAILEHYHGLELLNNYRILNLTGFRKALKKFEKVTKIPAQSPYTSEKIEPCLFASDAKITELLKSIEDLYAQHYTHGNKKAARDRLRGTIETGVAHTRSFRSGLFVGLGIPALAQGIYFSFQQDTRAAIPAWAALLQVYGGLLLPVVFAMLISINMLVWKRCRINYVFIFVYGVARIPILHSLLFNSPVVQPLWVGLTNNLANSRFRLLPGLLVLPFRYPAFGLWGVRFKMTGMRTPLPNAGRCVKRYADSGLYTHLINGGKYLSSIMYYVFYFIWRHNGAPMQGTPMILFVFWGVVMSVYTSGWDLLMDWSLMKPTAPYRFLRPELIYTGYVPVYYFAVFSNVFVRFIWIWFFVNPDGLNIGVRSFIFGCLEIARRFQWNFFRLENEHLGNMDQYRVTREVPLPYVVQDDIDDDAASHRSWDRWSIKRSKRQPPVPLPEWSSLRSMDSRDDSFDLESLGSTLPPIRPARQSIPRHQGGRAFLSQSLSAASRPTAALGHPSYKLSRSHRSRPSLDLESPTPLSRSTSSSKPPTLLVSSPILSPAVGRVPARSTTLDDSPKHASNSRGPSHLLASSWAGRPRIELLDEEESDDEFNPPTASTPLKTQKLRAPLFLRRGHDDLGRSNLTDLKARKPSDSHEGVLPKGKLANVHSQFVEPAPRSHKESCIVDENGLPMYSTLPFFAASGRDLSFAGLLSPRNPNRLRSLAPAHRQPLVPYLQYLEGKRPQDVKQTSTLVSQAPPPDRTSSRVTRLPRLSSLQQLRPTKDVIANATAVLNRRPDPPDNSTQQVGHNPRLRRPASTSFLPVQHRVVSNGRLSLRQMSSISRPSVIPEMPLSPDAPAPHLTSPTSHDTLPMPHASLERTSASTLPPVTRSEPLTTGAGSTESTSPIPTPPSHQDPGELDASTPHLSQSSPPIHARLASSSSISSGTQETDSSQESELSTSSTNSPNTSFMSMVCAEFYDYDEAEIYGDELAGTPPTHKYELITKTHPGVYWDPDQGTTVHIKHERMWYREGRGWRPIEGAQSMASRLLPTMK
ncbi:SPX-domain-containing protein [Clavulina sp. PMI_390]|nr:SPX-domain-containing protein [Clavulina sp. PMI_390]